MFNRLLVPLDGSRLAESVFPAVLRLAEFVPFTVTLLHVIEKKPPSSIHGDTHLHDVQQAEIYLSGISEKLKRAEIEVTTHVHTVPQGDIPRCIADYADELDQDLIVLCTHGTGGMRRFVFGSNAEQVLTHGATPVMLIQPDESGRAPLFGPERILVLLDATPATRPALAVSAELATPSGARLFLLTVVPTLASIGAEFAASGRFTPRTMKHVLDLAAEEAASHLQKEVDSLVARNLTASGRVERGDPASMAVRVAREVQADLVVIAARGLAGLSAFWADAMTRKVAGAYDGALLLIPRTGE